MEHHGISLLLWSFSSALHTRLKVSPCYPKVVSLLSKISFPLIHQFSSCYPWKIYLVPHYLQIVLVLSISCVPAFLELPLWHLYSCSGHHNLKVCLACSEVRKCACLYKWSKFALFCSNVPAEWHFSGCALQIICRMLRIVEVWLRLQVWLMH